MGWDNQIQEKLRSFMKLSRKWNKFVGQQAGMVLIFLNRLDFIGWYAGK